MLCRYIDTYVTQRKQDTVPKSAFFLISVFAESFPQLSVGRKCLLIWLTQSLFKLLSIPEISDICLVPKGGQALQMRKTVLADFRNQLSRRRDVLCSPVWSHIDPILPLCLSQSSVSSMEGKTSYSWALKTCQCRGWIILLIAVIILNKVSLPVWNCFFCFVCESSFHSVGAQASLRVTEILSEGL